MSKKQQIVDLVVGDKAAKDAVAELIDGIVKDRDKQWKEAIEKAGKNYPDSNSLYCAIQDILEAMFPK